MHTTFLGSILAGRRYASWPRLLLGKLERGEDGRKPGVFVPGGPTC
jgi:hypothetical protein